MSLNREIEFEQDVCNHLSAHGWLYEEGDAARYDRKLALYSADLGACLNNGRFSLAACRRVGFCVSS